MTSAESTVLRYLEDRLAAEQALGNELTGRLARMSAGRNRAVIEQHLGETLGHAERLRNRLLVLGWSGERPGLSSRMAGAFTGRTRALAGKLAGSGGAARALDDALEDCGAVAHEIAAYVALARLARGADDERTADLAAAQLADEQHMLQRLLAEIPAMAGALLPAGEAPEPPLRPGHAPAPAKRSGVAATTASAKRSEQVTRAAGRQARDKPRFDALSSEQAIARLGDVSQVDLARLADHERDHHNRSAVLARIAALRGEEPWAGYDALDVSDVRSVLGGASRERLDTVHAYELDHKNRDTVLKVSAR